MDRMRVGLGAALLLLQVAGIVYARFHPERYFSWAPYDIHTDYQVDVMRNGRRLSGSEVYARYRLPLKGTDHRSPQHLFQVFEQTEKRYHRKDPAVITLRYRVNGRPEQVWRWPR